MASFIEGEDSVRYVQRLALSVGASEAALRILISILIGFPIALFHRYNLYGKYPEYQHIYFIICGFCIGLFNYGLDIFHTLAAVLVVYIFLKTIGGSQLSVILTLVFTMGYLLTGYYMTSTDTYDIKWTMPQCVLTLRLTGLAFDLYDGSQAEEKLSVGSKKMALKQIPSLLEILAHTYYPASFLVGPQFPMKRYQDFVAGKFRSPGKPSDQPPDCLIPALYRFLTGVFYLAVYQGASIYYGDNYLIGEDFENASLLHRLFHLAIWGHVALYKYISCWLLCESVCIATGITYNGTDSDGSTKWDGCANVNLKVFEGATNFGHYIESFNINTNQWVFQYIYKRLKFLGNKYYSQIGVLLFLALWHGFHSGYYMTFFMEFVCMAMERDLTVILNRNKSFLLFLQQPGVKQLIWIVLKMYTLVFMGYCMAPFVLLSVQKWFRAYYSVFFIGHVVWMGWPAYRPIVNLLLPAAQEHKE